MSETFIYIIISVFGLVAGSFLNVCIYRLPRQKSIVMPSSFCPHCEKPIKWFDNIPVISFLILGGRCRNCRKNISWQYPLVEILTAALFCLNFFFFGLSFSFFIWCLFAAALLVISFVDLYFQLIPDIISVAGIFAGLLFSFFNPLFLPSDKIGMLLNSFLGALYGGASIYLLGIIGAFFFKKESMGFGDVKLMAMLGAFLGWKLALLCFFIAPVLGSAWGLILKIKYKEEIMPYGPFLSLAGLICLYWGKEILGLFFMY